MPDAASNRSLMIVMAYLWLLAVIPLFVESEDAEIRWHAKHGLALMTAEFALVVLYMVLTSVVSLAALALGVVMALLLVAGWVAILAVHVIAILKGLNGRRLRVPFVSVYADRF